MPRPKPRPSLTDAIVALRADLARDFARNPRLGQRITLVLWRAGNLLAHRRDPLSVLLRIVQRLAVAVWFHGVLGAEIPTSVPIGPGLWLPHSARGCVIHPSATIGADCTLYHEVTIGLMRDEGRAARIGDGVYLAAGAKVLGDITLADGTSVGANAVLLTDTLPGTTYVGVPAKPLGSAAPQA
ncbi:MAG: serine acetyltransferase [Actinobacteria bacterium]|nr:serine acetyltransferase [Actinomycetota bacterium]